MTDVLKIPAGGSMNLEELKSLALEIDCAALKGLVYPPSRIADVIGPRLHAIVAKLEAAQKQVEASAKRDKIKIDVINRANARIAELEKKLRDEYDDYPALAAFDKEQQ